MSLLTIELLAIAVLTAAVCALPGVFLVLRGASLMSDAISHALLLGIVGMFLWIRSLTSPFLLVGAGMAGFAVVVLTEYIMQRTQLSKDAAIGLVFPLFFSAAIILINMYTRDIHLDVDMVLLGDLVFAPFSRCIIAGRDCGPQAVWVIGFLCVAVTAIFFFLYRRLVVVLFDPLYASTIRAQPGVLYYAMMALTSVIAVSVFSVVGSVIVVALMIAPAASAFCTARSLKQMFIHALGYSVIAAVSGYWYAAWADVSIAGCIAMMSGVLFTGVILCSSRMGILGRMGAFCKVWLLVSIDLIQQHMSKQDDASFSKIALQKKYGWSRAWTHCVVWYAVSLQLIKPLNKGFYSLVSHDAMQDMGT